MRPETMMQLSLNVGYYLNDLTTQNKRGMFKFQDRRVAVYSLINASHISALEVYAPTFLAYQ